MYGFMRLLSRWACTLSEPAAARWGKRLGEIFWRLMPARRRRLAVENLLLTDLCKDREEAETIARRSAQRFGPMAMEVLRFPLGKDGRLLARIDWHGAEILDEIAASGRGCVLAASHTDNWEVLGAAVGIRWPDKVLAVGMHQENSGFDRFIREARQSMHQEVIYSTEVRLMYRSLQQGKWLALLYDQNNAHGILAPLLNTQALTSTGPAFFSRQRDVEIVPVHIYTAGDRFRVQILPPRKTDRDLPRDEAIAAMTAELNDILSERIRERPEDWFWLHNRWKSTRRLYGDPRTLAPNAPLKEEDHVSTVD